MKCKIEEILAQTRILQQSYPGEFHGLGQAVLVIKIAHQKSHQLLRLIPHR
jgi:hypothetical protein